MRRPTSCHRRHHRAGTHHQDTRPPTKPRPASPLNSSFTGARPTPPRSQRPVRRTLNVRDDRQLCASIYQLALCPRAAVREPPTQSSVNRPRPSCWQHHNTADLLSTESSTQSIWGKGRLFFLYSVSWSGFAKKGHQSEIQLSNIAITRKKLPKQVNALNSIKSKIGASN